MPTWACERVGAALSLCEVFLGQTVTTGARSADDHCVRRGSLRLVRPTCQESLTMPPKFGVPRMLSTPPEGGVHTNWAPGGMVGEVIR